MLPRHRWMPAQIAKHAQRDPSAGYRPDINLFGPCPMAIAVVSALDEGRGESTRLAKGRSCSEISLSRQELTIARDRFSTTAPFSNGSLIDIARVSIARGSSMRLPEAISRKKEQVP